MIEPTDHEALRRRAEAAEHNEREIRKHLACRIEAADRANAEAARSREKYADLLAVVIQPWTRDGDGAKLFKINLAWWETAKTHEEAEAIVREAVDRVKRKGGKGD